MERFASDLKLKGRLPSPEDDLAACKWPVTGLRKFDSPLPGESVRGAGAPDSVLLRALISNILRFVCLSALSCLDLSASRTRFERSKVEQFTCQTRRLQFPL